MVIHSFNNYRYNLIRVEERQEMLLVFSYKHRMATFLHISTYAVALTVIGLFITLTVSLSIIQNWRPFSLFNDFLYNLVNHFLILLIGYLLLFTILAVLFIIELFRLQKPLERFLEGYYLKKGPYMLDIIKKKGYNENLRMAESLMCKLNPLNHRFHHIDEIFSMVSRIARKNDPDFNRFETEYQYHYLTLMKLDGSTFIPGGDQNRLQSEHEEFEIIMAESLEFTNIEKLKAEERSLSGGMILPYIRKDLELKLSSQDSIFPASVDLVALKRGKGIIDQLIERLNIEKHLALLLTPLLFYAVLGFVGIPRLFIGGSIV